MAKRAAIILFLVLSLSSLVPPQAVHAAAPPDRIYFAQTGHYLAYGFLTYWRQNGQYAAFGAPISEEMTENGRTVQYFQQARFEYHIEWKGSPWETSLGLLGSETLTLIGRPQTQGDPWSPIRAVPNTATQTYFPLTGHSVSAAFKQFWDTGGLRRYGYALSQPYPTSIGGTQALVQDFERVRMIQSNGNISVAQLGYGVAQKKGVATGPLLRNPAVPVYSSAMFEHWIDINLSHQTATFYEGVWPVRTNLITGGIAAHPTPTGTFYILRRVYNETMVGGTPGAEDYYYLTDVLYTQYFTWQGHALHYAWWRQTFGVPGSHGCINMNLSTAAFAWNWLTIGSRVVIHY